ncbi:hypothetical protein E2C01_081743 [Portunus trituberculatus]|uniref:Uncharacterized protein n=1 Tax=Portunus trituberculatus TaxID=210409 RepID=A0A5B7J353_PORTR|nr:hypothetical protein [Portunus trituberculatus]
MFLPSGIEIFHFSDQAFGCEKFRLPQSPPVPVLGPLPAIPSLAPSPAAVAEWGTRSRPPTRPADAHSLITTCPSPHLQRLPSSLPPPSSFSTSSCTSTPPEHSRLVHFPPSTSYSSLDL